MLKPSQRIVLKVIERSGEVILNLAKSIAPLQLRLVDAWRTIGALQQESDFILLPDYLPHQFEALRKSLDAYQPLEQGIDRMSNDQIENCIAQIVDIYTSSLSRRTLKELQALGQR